MIAITILTTTIPICAKIETSLFAKYPPANNKITYAAPPTRIDTSQLRAAPFLLIAVISTTIKQNIPKYSNNSLLSIALAATRLYIFPCAAPV